MRMENRFKFRLLAVTTAGVLAVGVLASTLAVGLSAASTAKKSAAAHTKSTLEIHAIISLTGFASFLGTDEAKGLEALQESVNHSGGIDGHPLKFVISDDQSSPTVGVSLAAPLIHTVKVLIIGSVTAVDRPVDALVTSSGPVIYDLSPGDHPLRGSFVFSASDSTVSQARALAIFARTQKWTRVAAITSTDASGQDGWTSIQLAAGPSGITVVNHQNFEPTATDVTTQLAAIKAANPQALFIWTTGTPIETVFKGMQELGMDGLPTFTTPGNESYSELTGLNSILPAHLYFPSPAFQIGPKNLTGVLKQEVITFDTAMHKVGVAVPDEGASLSWDPGSVLVAALRAVGPNASADSIRSYIFHLKKFAGVDGYYNFRSPNVAPDQRGLGLHDVYVTEWSKSKKNWIGVSGAAGLPLSK